MAELLLNLVHRHTFTRKFGSERVTQAVCMDALGKAPLASESRE